MLAPEGDPSSGTTGIWYDVVWSDDKDVGMERRGPKPFVKGKSRYFIKQWFIGELPSKTAEADLERATAAAHRPQYTVEDKDKNCQTWTIEVVGILLGAAGVKEAEKVPKEE